MHAHAMSDEDNKEVTDSEAYLEAANLLKHDGGKDNNLAPKNAIEQEQSRYDNLLQQSRRKARIVMVVSLAMPLLRSTRYYILELYMQSLSEHASPATISSILFWSFLWYALFTLIAAMLGDRYGHDNILLLVFIFNAVGIFLEGIANNLSIFTVGLFVNRVQIQPIAMAYFAYTLPHKYAISEMANFFTMGAVVYLFGPSIAALLVQYTSYRNVFWINVLVLVLCIVVILSSIVGSQRRLQTEQKQLSSAFIEQQDKDDIFPICERGIFETDSSWRALFASIGRKELIILFIAIVQNCICWAIDTLLLFYYAMSVLNRLGEKYPNITLLYLSAQLLLMTIFYAVTNVMIPKLIHRILPDRVYIISVSCVLFIAAVFVIIHGINESIVVYWVSAPVFGMLFGAMSIGTEMCILELQPKQHSGKVSGAKEAIKIGCRAVSILLVGLYWDDPPYFNAMWYGFQVCAGIILILSLVVWMMLCHK